MKNIIKSCLNTKDIERIEALEFLVSNCDNITDKENEYIDFILKSFTDLDVTPTETIMIQQFVELDNMLTGAKELSINDLEFRIKELINKRKAKMASLSIMDIATRVERGKLSENDIEALREYIPDEVTGINEKAYDFSFFKDKYLADKNKPTGLLTGVEQVDDIIGGLTNGTMNTVLAFTSNFKCIGQHERVSTDKGLLEIRDIYKLFKQGHKINVLSEEGFKSVSHVHYEGKKDSIKVYVGGRLIETSPVHRFKVCRNGNLEWVMAQDLALNDLIAIKQESKFGNIDGDVDLCYLLGVLTGDGFIKVSKGDNKDYHSKICLCVPTSKLSIDMDYYFNKFFKTYNVRTVDNGDGKEASHYYGASLNQARSLDIKKAFVYMMYKNSNSKTLPKEIFEMNQDCVKSFLQGYFDTDGGKGTKKGMGVNLSSNSYTMLNDVARLLHLFEISCKIISVSDVAYRLYMDSHNSIKFRKLIGFRNVNKAYYEDSYIKRKCMIPVQKAIYNYYKENNLERSIDVCHVSNPSRDFVNKEKLLDVIDSHKHIKDIPIVKEILDNNYSFDKVTKLEAGNCIMYDLTVEGSPTYVVNGCVTHNTTWSANMAYHNTYNMGYNVAYISLEVPREDMLMNILGRHSNDSKFDKYPFISHGKIRSHNLTQEEEDYLLGTVLDDFNTNSKGQLFILDETDFRNMSYTEIRETLYRVDDICYKEKGSGLDAIIVDHAHLLKFTDNANSRGKSESNIVNDYISFFRRLTLKFRKTEALDENGNHVYRELCTILLAQANRTGYENACKKRGQYSLLAVAEFNEIERASYRIFSIWTDDVLKEAKEAMVCVLKNRSGRTQYDPMSVYADGEAYVFGDADSGGDNATMSIADSIGGSNLSDFFGEGDLGLF